MNFLFDTSLKLLVPTVILLHLYVSPYTKVEESFNIQAVHDILEYGIPFEYPSANIDANYDHVKFSGSVPRTFLGAVLLSELARPLEFLASNPAQMQMIVRGILGIANSAAILFFEQAVRQAYGITAGYWYLVLQASQFHVMYYASRTLPNMFAFAMTTLAMRFFLLSGFGNLQKRAVRSRRAIAFIIGAGVIFRSELAILLAVICVSLFLTRRKSIKDVIVPTGLVVAPVALCTTVLVDSFFWQAFPLWPEFVAFRYNTLQGKSSEWGTSPWHLYFTNAIPRLMMNPMDLAVCIPIGVLVCATRRFSLATLLPLVGYVCLYSILPHKEWRFIVYIIPLLTAVSASGAAWIWNRRAKSYLYSCLSLLLVLSAMSTFIISLAMSAISGLNYPGAHALNRLHELEASSNGIARVHLDNLSCQTGVTRFLQQPAPNIMDTGRPNEGWIYDKTESPILLRDPSFWLDMDYAISEATDLPGEWDVIDTVKSYDGIGFNGEDDIASLWLQEHAQRLSPGNARLVTYEQAVKDWMERHVTAGRWPVIRMKPKLHILKRRKT